MKQPSLRLLSMVGVGVAWASILSMPYAMLANVIPGPEDGLQHGRFHFFIVLPQILVAVALDQLVDSLLGGAPLKAVLAGGILMAVASLATLSGSDEVEAATLLEP